MDKKVFYAAGWPNATVTSIAKEIDRESIGLLGTRKEAEAKRLFDTDSIFRITIEPLPEEDEEGEIR